MKLATIIFLHGPSSSGKSTLAQALRAQWTGPLWHLSLDHLRDSGALPDVSAKVWAEIRPTVFDGLHRLVAGAAAAGNDVIFEHILDTPGWVADLKDLFSPFDVLFVGVHCGLDELARREAARGDRRQGSAADDFETVHQGRIYDVELDGTQDAAVNAATLLRAWKSGIRRSEFAS